jgi:hypothetical protein
MKFKPWVRDDLDRLLFGSRFYPRKSGYRGNRAWVEYVAGRKPRRSRGQERLVRWP